MGNGGLSLYRVGQAATRNPLCHTRSVSQLGIRFVIRAVFPLHKIETTNLRIQELVRSLIIIERTRLIESRNTLRWRKRSKFHLHLRNFLATWILQFVSCQVTHWIPQNNCLVKRARRQVLSARWERTGADWSVMARKDLEGTNGFFCRRKKTKVKLAHCSTKL